MGELITLDIKRNDKFSKSLWGTYASHIKNMIKGVEMPLSKKINFRRSVDLNLKSKGKEIHFALGFSHPVVMYPYQKVLLLQLKKNNITITGIDKELVGSFTAAIRALKNQSLIKVKECVMKVKLLDENK